VLFQLLGQLLDADQVGEGVDIVELVQANLRGNLEALERELTAFLHRSRKLDAYEKRVRKKTPGVNLFTQLIEDKRRNLTAKTEVVGHRLVVVRGALGLAADYESLMEAVPQMATPWTFITAS
jgi:hypothetical protein